MYNLLSKIKLIGKGFMIDSKTCWSHNPSCYLAVLLTGLASQAGGRDFMAALAVVLQFVLYESLQTGELALAAATFVNIFICI